MTAVPKVTACPTCGYRFDAVAAIGGDGPREPSVGDVSLCIRCAGVNIWTAYGLRRPTREELDEILTNPLVLTAVRGIKAIAEHSE